MKVEVRWKSIPGAHHHSLNHTAFVTGATGFLGRSLVSELLARQHRVIGLARSRASLPQEFLASQLFTFIEGDIAAPETYRSALRTADSVFHFAGTQTPSLSAEDPLVSVDPGIKSSLIFFLECETARITQIGFPSTGGAIYGSHHIEPATEAHSPHPESPYAIEKLSLEHYLHFICHRSGIRERIYRITNPYGIDQRGTRHHGVIARFVKLAMNNEPLVIYGDRETSRDFIFVDDVSRIVVDLMDCDEAFGVLNVGSGISTTLDDLVHILENILDRQLDVTYVDRRVGDTSTTQVDTRKLQGIIPHLELTSLDDGLRKVIAARSLNDNGSAPPHFWD